MDPEQTIPTVLEPVVRPTRYTVNCMPEDAAPDSHVFAIHLDRKRDGSWVVHDGFRSLNADGEWNGEHGINGYDAEFRHDLETALRLAKEAAPNVRVNGLTPADALARIARLKESES